MRTNQRRNGSSTCALSFLTVSCAAILGILPTVSLYADTTITTSQTQNGGVLAVTPPTLLVTHSTNNPVLTLADGATTSGVQAVILGNLNNHEGLLDINGGSLLANSGTGLLIGTYGSTSVYRGYSYLGLNTGSSGMATVSGANSNWTNSQQLFVGYSGVGTMSILNGGNVSSTGGLIGFNFSSNGTVSVNGANSTWSNRGVLTVGNSGMGTMSIQNSGSVNNMDLPTLIASSYIGNQSSSTGMVTVSGANSSWETTGRLTVGNEGTGKLSIQNGGSVRNKSAVIGALSGSNGTTTVSDVNSNWSNSDSLSVGLYGTGTLSILNGSSVSSTYGYIAINSTSNGTVTVSGANSSWTNSEQLTVGNAGKGTLTIENGGSVINSSGFIISAGSFNSTVTVSGANSTWMNYVSLYIGGSSTTNYGVGTLSINNFGKVAVSSTTKIWNNSAVNLDGGALETGTLQSASSSGKIVLTGNNNQIRIGSNSTFVGGIQGTGGFVKTGPGTLTLNNANTYAGRTTVEQGTLDVQTALLNNGPTSVSIAAADDSLMGNPILSRRRNINASYAGFGAAFAGGLNTTAVLLSGTNLSGTDNAMSMQVRQRTAVDAGGLLVSDVLSLTGMVNNTAVDLHQTDLFVLQMSYNPSMLGDNEAALAAAQGIYLVTFDENLNQWVNAVSSNIGGTPSYVGDTPWNNSYTTLGQFGVDTNSNTVWAVINHNSQFAVTVPEPSTLVFGALVSLGMGWLSLRRQRKLGSRL